MISLSDSLNITSLCSDDEYIHWFSTELMLPGHDSLFLSPSFWTPLAALQRAWPRSSCFRGKADGQPRLQVWALRYSCGHTWRWDSISQVAIPTPGQPGAFPWRSYPAWDWPSGTPPPFSDKVETAGGELSVRSHSYCSSQVLEGPVVQRFN